jgi:hypothetical protein
MPAPMPSASNSCARENAALRAEITHAQNHQDPEGEGAENAFRQGEALVTLK